MSPAANQASGDYDVVVVGAGPIGLATALLLTRQAGFASSRIAVVDRRVPDDLGKVAAAPMDLRVFALSRASERILRVCGAWDDIRATRAESYERMHVWHADVPPHGGDALVFDAAEIGERDLGVIVENSVLQAALAGALRRTGIALLDGEVTALTQDRGAAHLRLGDRVLRARLVVGADGASSRVRDLAGLVAARGDYGQTALVAMVRTAQPHQRTAWQRFLGDGTLAFLPLGDGRSSIVWSLPTARADRLLALSPEAFERELEQDLDGALGKVQLESDRIRFPLWRLTAEQYVTARLALVGDAAHVVHPLAGQGANLGLLDAAALADVLADGLAQREDPGAERILRRYERWRRSENEIMATAIDAFDRLLARGSGRLAKLAQRGMPWVSRSGIAKRLFIERAMGLAGEIARRGRALNRGNVAIFGIQDRFAGMAAMLTGVAAFALMDAGLKLLTAHYPSAQVAALRGLAALPVVFVWALYAGGAGQLLKVRWPLHVVRGVLSVVMMITFTFALKELSLAKAYALFFIAPLLIALMSIFILGERVQGAQWLAIVVGFAGVLIVLKPDTVGFGWAGALAVLGTAVCYSLSSVLVKIIGRTDSTQSMIFWMTCMLAVGASALALPNWQPLQGAHYPILLGVAFTGAVGQWGITEAFKRAPAATVAPLEYSGLAWVMIIDLLVWSVLPSWRTLAGAGVIICSGLYLLRFEARRTAQSVS